MPGLRYPGPPPTSAANGSYSYFHDWEPHVDTNSVHFAEPLPFVPTKHKACRPPQLHVKGKPGSVFNGLGCSMSMSATAQANNDSDDLAAMVLDFIESGSPAFLEANDSDTKPPNIHETLQALLSSYAPTEAELANTVRRILLAIDVDNDLICNSGANDRDCRCGCIKRLIVSELRAVGFKAAVCKSKWEGSGRVLGGPVHMGEYEYIDVELRSGERLIVDVDFRDQFVLARATPNYLTSLQVLPTVFVGTPSRLEQILQAMAEAVKLSLKQNSMPLPPWRTLDFMKSKWLSPHEHVQARPSYPVQLSSTGRLAPTPETRQCDVQLRRIKDSLFSELGSSVSTGRGRRKPRILL